MKRIMSIALSLIMMVSVLPVFPITSNAYSDSDDWAYTEYGRFVELKYYYGNAKNVVIPETIDNYIVREIGSYCFSNEGGNDDVNSRITSVTIPDTVELIDSFAFDSCDELRTVNFGDGLKKIEFGAFNACSSLRNVTLPDSLETICEYAFDGCTSLSTLYLGNGVKTIDRQAFRDCESLDAVNIPSSVNYIGEEAFLNCERLDDITFSGVVYEFGDSVFSNTAYYNDESNWENKVLYIGKHLISAKVTLRGNYSIKPGTKVICNAAFYSCIYITGVTIPNGVERIDSFVFYDCEGISKISIPESVISVGYNPFIGTKLFDNNSINYFSVDGILIWVNASYAGEFKVEKGTRVIADGTFDGCSKLKSVVFPYGVKYIGDYLFESCKDLGSVTIPNTVKKIGYNCFHFVCNNETVYLNFEGTPDEFKRLNVNLTFSYNRVNSIYYYEEYLESRELIVNFITHKHSGVEDYSVAPTCTSGGYTVYTCTVCGETFVGDKTSALGHRTEIDKAVPATFKSAGKTQGKHCSRCGTVITEQKTIAKLVSPTVNKLTAGKKLFTATWKKAPTVDGYQIQYATNSSFGSAKSVTVNYDSTTKKIVKKLKAKKKYYVRVRAFKNISGKRVYSSWSKAKTVTTKK